ncbi:hypothetical protein ACH4YO_18970 [Streptomyces noursei]|uniref:hypothetical protein n=1 Tax=Streptomyces noursei TaxID=1971 RepID=UPI0037876C93
MTRSPHPHGADLSRPDGTDHRRAELRRHHGEADVTGTASRVRGPGAAPAAGRAGAAVAFTGVARSYGAVRAVDGLEGPRPDRGRRQRGGDQAAGRQRTGLLRPRRRADRGAGRTAQGGAPGPTTVAIPAAWLALFDGYAVYAYRRAARTL